MISAAILAIALSAAAGPIQTHAGSHGGQRSLVTPRPYPIGQADSVHRPGFNGRVWQGTVRVGPQDGAYATDDGAAAYGAVDSGERVLARVNTEVVGFSPWQAMHENGLKRMEASRQEWLKEQGYVGGVRTFVNDAYAAQPEVLTRADDDAGEPRKRRIEPRAVIQLAPEVTKFRKRMQVRVVAPDANMARSATVAVRVVPMAGQPEGTLAAK